MVRPAVRGRHTRQARSDQDRAARALDDARAGREAAELRVTALEEEAVGLRAQRAEAVRDLKAHEVRANARLDDLKAAQADLARWYDLPSLRKEALVSVTLSLRDETGVTFTEVVPVKVAP